MDVIAQPEVVRIQGKQVAHSKLECNRNQENRGHDMVDPHSSSKIFDS